MTLALALIDHLLFTGDDIAKAVTAFDNEPAGNDMATTPPMASVPGMDGPEMPKKATGMAPEKQAPGGVKIPGMPAPAFHAGRTDVTHARNR